MAGMEIAGRRFQNEADYKAACRDAERIKRIRAEVDLANPSQTMALYQQMESGSIRFETIVGNDFDDEIYELVQKYKKGAQTEKVKKEPSKDKKRKKEKISLEECDTEIREEVLRRIKRKERLRMCISLFAAVIAIGCLGYFAIYSRDTVRNQKDNNILTTLKKTAPVAEPVVVNLDPQEEITVTILDEYKNLYIKNKSIIGWLKIDDTIIDYPVMQTSNNEYYLNHNFDGQEDKNGCLFLDKDCDVIKRNDNLIIYGHHMKSGKMFGGLNKYSDIKYYEKHPYIRFDSIYEKGLYQVMYVFRDKVYSEEQITFKYYQFLDANSADEYRSNLQEMAKMSLYHTGVEATYGDELLTLSTCDHTETDGRFVVVAKRIE